MKRRFCLSFSLLCLLIRSLKIVIVETRAYGVPYQGKKSGKNFSQVANIFPRLNFNPILFNSTRLLLFFKTRLRNFPDLFKTFPNSLTRPHLLPSNFKVD